MNEMCPLCRGSAITAGQCRAQAWSSVPAGIRPPGCGRRSGARPVGWSFRVSYGQRPHSSTSMGPAPTALCSPPPSHPCTSVRPLAWDRLEKPLRVARVSSEA